MQVKVFELAGIATAFREDLQAGWMRGLVELVLAETLSTFLDMAAELRESGYVPPAAVVAGVALETQLRSLADKHKLAAIDPKGKPVKADRLNADLKGASVYSGIQAKQVTAWLGLRNAAAQANGRMCLTTMFGR